MPTMSAPKPRRKPPTPPTPPPPPHILRIPGEIRNQIYRNLVVSSQPVRIYRSRSSTKPPSSDNNDPLSILTPVFLACRQFHLEASAVFYSHNKFALPRNASQAPHQLQTNLLFRWFLDRIGPRNAALIRHLVVPFPADPEAFVRAHFGSDPGLEDGEGGPCRALLVAALRARCPALETIEMDIRWNNHWVKLLRPSWDAMGRMFGWMDEVLRETFPRLREVELCLAGATAAPGRAWSFVGQGPLRGSAVMSQAEWEWVRQVVEGGLGWRITVAEKGDGEGQGEEDSTSSGWASRWYPLNPRNPRHHLYDAPEMALESEIHDRLTTRDILKANVRFATAWLRSPARAMRDWEEAQEWLEWKRTMLAGAGPVGVPLYCYGTSSSAAPVKVSMKDSLKWGVFSILAARQPAAARP